MEVVVAIIVLFIIIGLLGKRSAPLSEEEMEERRRFGARMAMMDYYNVGPFQNDPPGK
jgi:hypothetical protein